VDEGASRSSSTAPGLTSPARRCAVGGQGGVPCGGRLDAL